MYSKKLNDHLLQLGAYIESFVYSRGLDCFFVLYFSRFGLDTAPADSFSLLRFDVRSEKVLQIKIRVEEGFNFDQIQLLCNHFDADKLYFRVKNDVFGVNFRDAGAEYHLERLSPVYSVEAEETLFKFHFENGDGLAWVVWTGGIRLVDLDSGSAVWEWLGKMYSHLVPDFAHLEHYTLL